MTITRNRNRLLRLAGVMLLTAALAIIPAGAAFAADSSQTDSGSGTFRTPLLPPTPVENFSGELTRNGESALEWEDSADTVSPYCFGPALVICMFAAFYGYSAADIDAPTEYAIERRSVGFRGTSRGAWAEVARVSGTPPAAAHSDNPGSGGKWGRSVEYRVKACNNQGCSGWSDNVSVWVRPGFTSTNPDNSPF